MLRTDRFVAGSRLRVHVVGPKHNSPVMITPSLSQRHGGAPEVTGLIVRLQPLAGVAAEVGGIQAGRIQLVHGGQQLPGPRDGLRKGSRLNSAECLNAPLHLMLL